MKFVYWNSKKHTNFSTISDILAEVSPDILFLAETEEDLIIANNDTLDAAGFEHFENPGCDRIVIVKKSRPFLISVNNLIIIRRYEIPKTM